MYCSETLSSEDAQVLETVVVPRYLSLYGDLLIKMLLAGSEARMAHLGCRVGYPDLEVFESHPATTIVGVDGSPAALERARRRAKPVANSSIEYILGRSIPCALTSQSFSHVLCLHPIASLQSRVAILAEVQRLLYSGGQALLALPIRGSFQELSDLLREYALKHDDGALGRALEEASSSRPSIESLSDELEEVGLEDVDVEIRHEELCFESGQAFLDDPVSRLLVIPEVEASLGGRDLTGPLAYVRDAIDKYWSEGTFSLAVNVGCASARKPW